MQTDEDLLAAVAGGDREAFGALFRRRRADVYRFTLHMTGEPAVADDVTQEVFVAVMHDAARYERAGRPSPRGCAGSRAITRAAAWSAIGGSWLSAATTRTCRSVRWRPIPSPI